MLEYIALLVAAVLLGIPLCSGKCGKWGKAVYCVGAAVVFIFVSALRFDVSYDYNSYATIYTNLTYMDIFDLGISRTEKGFTIPLYIINLVSDNYVAMFVYTSIVIYSLVFLFIYKYSDKPWISVAAFLCLGLFFNSLCFLRQFMAALVVLYAIKFVTEKSPYKFLIMILMAATFHWSALIMIPIYFFLRIKPGYCYLGIMSALTIVMFIFSRQIMDFAVSTLYVYKGYTVGTNVEATTGLPPTYTIMFGIVFIVAFIFRKQLMEKNPSNATYLNCLMFVVIFELFGTKHGILSRFAILLYLAPILYMIPDLVLVIKDYIAEKIKTTKIVKATSLCSAMVAIAFMFGIYMTLMFNDYNGVMPYDTIIDKTEADMYSEGNSGYWDEEWDEDDEDWEEDEDLEDEEWDEDEDISEETVTSEQTPIIDTTTEISSTDEIVADDDIIDDDDFEEEFTYDESDEDALSNEIINQLEGIG